VIGTEHAERSSGTCSGGLSNLAAALADAAEARQATQEAEARLQLLTDATTAISGALDPDEAVHRLTRLAVPAFADWCLVALVDGEDDAIVVHHRDPTNVGAVAALRQHILDTRRATPAVRQVLADGRSTVVEVVTDALLEAYVEDAVRRDAYRALGMCSVVIAPLWARGRVIGNVSFVIGDPGRRPYSPADAATATELAQRTALTLDNARLINRERAAAETLQRSLLPALPDIAGLSIAARYLPANNRAQVGGDWYDVLPLPDGSIGIAVGDVMGHDLEAAAAMGQLRSVLRGYAWDGDQPAPVLSRLDRLVNGLEMAQLATAVYGRLRLSEPGSAQAQLEYANAGHLPPVLRMPDGATSLLDGAHAPMIGLPVLFDRSQETVAVAPGSTLVLYTDGLVESRELSTDDGIATLRAALEQAPAAATPDELCDLVLAAMSTGEQTDDLALLILRLDG